MRLLLVAFLIGLLPAWPASVRASSKGQTLFTIPDSGYLRQVFVDEDGNAVGYSFQSRTGQQRLFLHGKWVIGYDSIPNDSVVTTPDGKHIAFVGIRGDSEYAVVDGTPGPAFARIDSHMTGFSPNWHDHDGSILLSPDASHWLYIASTAAKLTGEDEIILDGKVVARIASTDIGSASVSPDWRHLAYTKRDFKMGWILVLDGRERRDATGVWGQGVEFSPDGKRVSFSGWQDGMATIIDGDKVVRTGRVGDVVFSPDPSRLAILTYSKIGTPPIGQSSAFIDGKAGPVYRHIDLVVFSPDGKHVVYRAMTDKENLVVCDGKPGPEFDDVEHIRFSPRGDRLIYQVLTFLSANRSFDCPSRWDVIVRDANGVNHTYPGEEAAFDAGEKHFAYFNGTQVFIDGKPQATVQGECLGTFRFLPNGHLLMIIWYRNKVSRVEISADS